MKTARTFSVAALAAIALAAQEPEFRLTITKGPPPEISWPSQTGFNYELQVTDQLQNAQWQPLGSIQAGTGATLRRSDPQAPGAGKRYYRAVRTVASSTGQISPQAVAPQPGVVYPEKTIIGAAPLGLQYSIPSAWKGAVREGTSSMIFGSDTEPGLVLGFLSLAGDAAFIARTLGQDFRTDDGTFRVTRQPVIANNRVTIEWTVLEHGIQLQLVAVVHPSGGAILFGGFFVEANRAVMERVLNDFAQSTVTVARRTRQDLVDLISGKKFAWAKSTSTGSGGTSGSLSGWTQKNAFFCPGTFEITTYSESSFSGNLVGGGFYSGASSSNSTDAGDWTIIETDFGPVLVMVSSSGIQSALIRISGNTVYFGDQEFSYTGQHACPAP